MMKNVSVLAACVLSVACDRDQLPLSVRMPTAATPPPTASPTPTPTAPPSLPPFVLGGMGPVPVGVADSTTIRVGDVVNRRVVEPPNCDGDPWPCQYFRVTTTAAGTLIAQITYDRATQPGQTVDMTLEDATGRRVWAQWSDSQSTRVSARVQDAVEIVITLWYTHTNLQLELRTSLEPN